MDKKLQLEINELEHKIDTKCIEIDDDTGDIKEFRQRVFFTHDLIEKRMIPLIVDKFLERLSPESITKNCIVTDDDFINWAEFMGDMSNYLRDLSNLDKLKLAKTIGAIVGDLYSKANELNTIRNAMGHTRDERYKKYIDQPEKMLEALKNMVFLIEETENTTPFFDFIDEKIKNTTSSDEDDSVL
jgi:hypothetical protein